MSRDADRQQAGLGSEVTGRVQTQRVSPYGMLTAAELFLNRWGILDVPPIERGMIHRDTPLAHHFLQLPV